MRGRTGTRVFLSPRGCCDSNKWLLLPPRPQLSHSHTRASFPSSSNIIGVCTGKKIKHAQHHMDSPTPSSVATDRKCVAFLAPGGFKMPWRFVLGGLFLEFRKIRLHCTRQAKNATYVFFPVSLFSIADLLLKNIPRIQYHLRKNSGTSATSSSSYSHTQQSLICVIAEEDRKRKKMMMKKTKDDFCYICVTSLWSRLCIQTEKREDV